jgi:hypothetical protein
MLSVWHIHLKLGYIFSESLHHTDLSNRTNTESVRADYSQLYSPLARRI